MSFLTRRSLRIVSIGAAAALALGLTGCGSGDDATSSEPSGSAGSAWDGVLTKADEEGQVTVYSVAAPAQNDPLVEAFQEAHPNITVNMVRGATDLPARIDSEIAGNAEGADVFLYFGQQWYADNKEHIVAPTGPATEDLKAEDFAVPGAPLVGYVPAGILVWNTEVFPDGFKEWNDILDPEVKGKLALRSNVTSDFGSFLQFLEDTQGPDYIPGLAELDPKFFDSVVPMTQAVASGEVGVSIYSTVAAIKDLQSQGAPIDYTVPEETFSSVYYLAEVDNARNKNAAQVFVDFAMSPEGQKAFNGEGFGGSVLPDIEGTVPADGLTILNTVEFTPDKVDAWATKFKDIFGL